MKKIILFLLALSFIHAEETTQTAIQEITTAAKTFLASLNDEQKAKATFPFDAEERENFKFTPQPRKGIPLEALDDNQRALAKKILTSVLSAQGMQRANTIMEFEKVLRDIEKDPVKRNPLNYYTLIFGEPSESGTWAWNWEGHHCSIDVTLIDGKIIVAAPTFMGANPGKVLDGPLKGTAPFAEEEKLSRQLVNDVFSEHKEVIFSEESPKEIISAEDRNAKLLEPVGITADSLDEKTRKNLLELMSFYAKRYRPAIADEMIQKISALPPKEIHFGWAGSREEGKAFYYRIQTPNVLIEVVNFQNNANHIHTVWRDVKNDFGRDFLKTHLDKHE